MQLMAHICIKHVTTDNVVSNLKNVSFHYGCLHQLFINNMIVVGYFKVTSYIIFNISYTR